MAILKNGRTVAGDWRYENIVDKPLINGNEIKENNNSSASLDIFKVISKADFESPTFTQNPQCVYAVIDTDENIRFHYTNQLESTDPNYKKYVCKDYWPVEELPAEPAVTEVEENVRLSSILYWLKKTYKHPTTEEVYLPGLYGWVPTLIITDPQTYEWKNLGGANIDKKTIYATEEGTISTQVGGHHNTSGDTVDTKLVDNVNPTIITQDDDFTYITLPITTYEQYTPNTVYKIIFKYQGVDKTIEYTPKEVEDDLFKLNLTEAIIGLSKTDYPSATITDYTECNVIWLKPKEETISYINPLYFPLDLTTLKVEDGKITSYTSFYELNDLSDTTIDPSQNEVLQKILDDMLIKEKVVVVNFINKHMLLSSASISTDTSGTFVTLASTLNNKYTLVKIYYDPITSIVIGGKKYTIQPIKHSVVDPGIGSPLATDCIIAVCEDERKVTFVSEVPFKVGTLNGWFGDGTVEVSTDYGETWVDATSSTGGTIAEQSVASSEDKYEIYVRGNNNSKLNNITAISSNENDMTIFTSGPITAEEECNLEVKGDLIYLLDYKKSIVIDTKYLFIGLFRGLPIVKADKIVLSQETMGESSYYYMFSNCSKLITPPELPSIDLKPGCYCGMFRGCESLATAPALPATILPESGTIIGGTKIGCYQEMFCYCKSLTTTPTLPAKTLTDYCYKQMFQECYSLTTTPTLPVETLADYCYEKMFAYCRSLTTASALPVETLANYCYRSMFYECSELTTPPTLPATTLADGCYKQMFNNCSKLEIPPALPATQLTPYCYDSMFSDCTSLKTAPELPATTLAIYCYNSMFYGCKSLTTAPELPATTLVENCYEGMFNNCTSLITPPEFPATTLAENCCKNMFLNCTSIQKPADVLALEMKNHCFDSMYKNCTGICWENYGYSYIIPKVGLGTEAEGWSNLMFEGNSGHSIPITPEINIEYYYVPTTTFTFYSKTDVEDVKITNNITNTNIEYSLDNGTTWISLSYGSQTPASKKIIVRGKIYINDDVSRLVVSGTQVAVKGNLIDKIPYKNIFATQPLVDASELIGATILIDNCYSNMFNECSLLKTAPQLPATTLANNCYYSMFHGCSSLKAAPELPATVLADNCYRYMFNICTSLTTVPTELPATILADSCYKQMFYKCSKLKVAPELPATTLANNCYESMFSNCELLVIAPELPATMLTNKCYYEMFRGCKTLKTPPQLPATTLASSCYYCMFEDCETLATAPELPATTLVDSCYRGMFHNCATLKIPPELPATQLANFCYASMFQDCTSLIASPTISATTLAGNCCSNMFYNCTSLITPPPTLLAETLAKNCYQEMFKNCTSLEAAPTILATTLDKECCYEMFSGCESLATAPELLATTLTEGCYLGMFLNCTSLTATPELPATTLAKQCYAGMFMGCTSLTIPPILPAIQMEQGCYSLMFKNCNKIIWANTGSAYRIPYSGIGAEAAGWNTDMFKGNDGMIPEGSGTPVINRTYFLVTEFTELTFTNSKADIIITNNLNVNAQFSIDDGTTWASLPIGSSTTPASSKVIIKAGIDNTTATITTPSYLAVAGTNVKVSGELIDGVNYNHLFMNQSAIVDASGIVGASLLAEGCYEGMFKNCSSLTSVPELPATTLINKCYKSMFEDCRNLLNTPELPSTTAFDECYAYMFNGCESITSVPELPATTLGIGCYQYMFQNCTSIKTLPILKALEMKDSCYQNMFYGCKQFIWGGGLPYRLPSVGMGTGATDWSKDMFGENSGENPATPEINKDYSYCLEGILFFTSDSDITIQNNLSYDVYYSTSYEPKWNLLKHNETTNASTILMFKGVNHSYEGTGTNAGLSITGTNVTVEGALVSGNNYTNLLREQNAIIDASKLNVGKIVGNHGCDSMFKGCVNLVNAPKLSAITIGEYAYSEMFNGCTSLTAIPDILAEIISKSACYHMFEGCTAIITPALLDVRIIEEAGCDSMFKQCTALTTAPLLENLVAVDKQGCASMFEGCTALKTCSKLASLRTSEACYQYMYKGCSSLKEMPELPAIYSSNNCYYGMFEGCNEIQDALPVLPSLVMSTDCYSNMFFNCDQYIWGEGIPYRIPVEGIGRRDPEMQFANNMFAGNGGDLPEITGTPIINTIYNYMAPGTLLFKTDIGNLTITNNLGYDIYYMVPEESAQWILFKANTTVSDYNYIILKSVVKGGPSTTQPGLNVLGSSVKVSGKLVSEGNYSYLFYGLTSLVDATYLIGANKLSDGCYISMFENCNKLQTPMTLPAVTMKPNCYQNMFRGCSSIYWGSSGIPFKMPSVDQTGIPADDWGKNMFEGNSGTDVPGGTTGTPELNRFYYCIPTTTLTFYNKDTDVSDVRVLNSLAVDLEYSIDNGTSWHSLPIGSITPEGVNNVIIRAITDLRYNSSKNYRLKPQGTEVAVKGELINKVNYRGLFNNADQLKYADELICTNKLDEIQGLDYEAMFQNCTSLVTTPELPATTLSTACYQSMFSGCTALTTPPQLPTETLAGSCYNNMFCNCTSLTTAPELPATTLPSYCYNNMFSGCTSLETPPTLSATTLDDHCCYEMFEDCTALKTAPELPATNLGNYCYANMFSGCTSLKIPPALPAEILNHSCYRGMFYECSELTTPPELPATTLAPYCYSYMFYKCTKFTVPCELPATTMAQQCYNSMFSGCTGITWASSGILYRLPPGTAMGTEASGWNTDMFKNNSGELPEGTGTPTINREYYYIPTTTLTFESKPTFGSDGNVLGDTNAADVVITNNLTVDLKYSLDNGTTWVDLAIGSSTPAAAKVMIKGGINQNETYGESVLNIAGTNVAVSGQLLDRINYSCLFEGQTALKYADGLIGANVLCDYCYTYMFNTCTSLTTPPTLPAKTLAESCYECMFQSCHSLTTAPELPAETLAYSCYYAMFQACSLLETPPTLPAKDLTNCATCYEDMFNGCTSLKTAPELPAETLTFACYAYMFSGCTALKTAPELPATDLTNCVGCYCYMFSGCTSLKTAPELPATTLANQCYYEMFENCKSLTIAPELPATTLATQCYRNMFSGCTSLTIPCELPATTMSTYCYQNMFSGCTGITWASSGILYRLPSGTAVGTEADNWNTDMFKNNSGELPGGTGTPAINTEYFIASETTLTFEGRDTNAADVVITNNLTIPLKYSLDDGTTWVDLAKNASTPAAAKVMIKGRINQSENSDNYLEVAGTNVAVSGQLQDEINYNHLFRNQNDLKYADGLIGANVLCRDCYNGMFQNCSSLTTPPRLPATTLTDHCYCEMFSDCYSLTTPPELPATTLAVQCYQYMFHYCTSLTTAPELGVINLGGCVGCYMGMFYGCTSLKTAPELPATTLCNISYFYMFSNCTSLETAPELPATTLEFGCYRNMFSGCTSLTAPCKLPATTMYAYCYEDMFSGCTGITWASSGTPYRLPAGKAMGTEASEWNTNMFKNNSGTLPEGTGTPAINTEYYYVPITTLTFEGRDTNAADVVITNWLDIALKYSLDNGASWSDLAIGSSTPTAAKVMIKGCINDSGELSIAGTNVAVSGQLQDGIKYRHLFYGQTALKYADGLIGASVLGEEYYYSMFCDCTSLTTPPQLPATDLTGCDYCYSYMFEGCTSLETAPELPATTLARNCYEYMFRDCTLLKTAPELPATTLAEHCYVDMFQYCTSLTTPPPSLPATDLTGCDYCCSDMFAGCTSLKTAPELPAETLAKNCYQYMFNGCTKLETAPTLPATTLAEACYMNMFANCTSLKTASELPATTLAKNCYAFMFRDCKSLKTAPELPATNLTGCNGCYHSMFKDCSSLKTAQAILATSVAEACCYDMFYGCSELTTPPPELKATEATATSCYHTMFRDCKKLKSAPIISATKVGKYSCCSMFNGCKLLETPPELPATTLAEYCYINMFYNCESLKLLPTLPATTMAQQCYESMFYGCSGIVWGSSGIEYRLPPGTAQGTEASGWNTNMFSGNSGTLPEGTGTPAINKTYYYIPETTLTFESKPTFGLDGNVLGDTNAADVVITNKLTIALKYSLDDGSTWTNLAIGSSTPAAAKVMIKGGINQINASTSNKLGIAGTNVAVSGQLHDTVIYKYLFFEQTALKYADGLIGANTLVGYCYYAMFYSCTSLTTVPALPAETLAIYCYASMFSGCTSLTTPPTLPATTLKSYCYQYMFRGCTSLETAPELPATTLSNYCYQYMFYGCNALTTAPELPATTLATYCYSNMFNGCKLLGTAPNLLAINLTNCRNCYEYMFSGCTSLKTPPELQAETLSSATQCYQYMFQNCTSLETPPALPATTLAPYCYQYMFNGCKLLGTAPVLPAETLTGYCYQHMFRGCESLKTPPALPATTLANYCYYSMFYGCKTLATAPALQAETLKDSCYAYMFSGCESLKTPPALPATTLATQCYQYMFSGCTSLTTAPALPATTLASYCYYSMFYKCASLESAPALPAETLTNYCYSSMFYYCSKLKTAPELPATTLATYCYDSMFCGCEVLETAPELPATTLATYCYSSMFYNCRSLKSLPTLSATTMSNYCYQNMFKGCTEIAWGSSGISYRLPAGTAQGTEADNWNTDMFSGNSGTLPGSELETPTPGTPAINKTYYYVPITTLTFEGRDTNAADVVITNKLTIALKYSLDNGSSWTNLAVGSATPAAAKVMIKGGIAQNNASTSNTLGIAGTNVAVSGQLQDRVNYRYLFYGQTALKYADGLIGANTLVTYCYQRMFYNCTSLTTTPELPATQLKPSCYQYMFYNCTSLTIPTELPATTLVDTCYYQMFYGCSGIVWGSSGTPYRIPKEGIGTEAAANWNYNMFKNNSGTLPGGGTPAINTEYYIIPETTLTFESKPTFGLDGNVLGDTNAADVVITNKLTIALKYSLDDGSTWTNLAIGSSTPAAAKVMIKGRIYNSGNYNNKLGIAGTNVAVSGQLQDKVSYRYLFDGQTALKYADGLIGANTLDELCYSAMFNGCTSLTTPPTLPATQLTNNCYGNMFYGCTSLTTAPELPATTLANNCYGYMFSNCTSLTILPTLTVTNLTGYNYCYNGMFNNCKSLEIVPNNYLPATQLSPGCYYNMFQGCSELKTPPALPATQLATQCYQYMFYNCSKLETAPALPAETLTEQCYSDMFRGCESLKTAPALPATTLANYCYQTMFGGCAVLETPPALPATTLAKGCYQNMFSDCTSLKTPPALPAETLMDSCYSNMFAHCTSLETPPALPATTLAYYCCNMMFYGCSELKTPPALPATQLATQCYQYMFYNCSKLETAPALPAETLTEQCYYAMFSGCESLKTAPELPATTLATYCYSSMFYGCKSLETAPELPATTLAERCYAYMFSGCSKLETPPELPATTLASYCYSGMFRECHSLSIAPELPVTTLSEGCYYYMLDSCTSLETPPALPATTLTRDCYGYMFNGCTSLKSLPTLSATTMSNYCYQNMFKGCTEIAWGSSGISYRLPAGTAQGVEATGWNTNMFSGNSGTLPGSELETPTPGTPAINTEYHYVPITTLTFEGRDTNAADVVITNNLTVALKYSLDNGATWVDLAVDSATPAAAKVMIKGGIAQNNATSINRFGIAGTNVAVSGQLQDGVDYKHLFNGQTALKYADGLIGANVLVSYCYQRMFYGCASLTTPPELPATTLAIHCYPYMFGNCKSLTTAPELPATILTTNCYYYMFSGCTSLTTAPELPAETLADSCCYYMFSYCTSLKTPPPTLPATTLINKCYSYMFYGCTALKTTPELPATELAPYCYQYMFRGCTSLTIPPELPATTLRGYCYQYMFAECTSLTAPCKFPTFTSVSAYSCNCMFAGCTDIFWGSSGTPYTIILSGSSASYWNTNMFASNSGTNIPTTPTSGRVYYYNPITTLTFESRDANAADVRITNAIGNVVKYSVNNGSTWTNLSNNATTPAAAKVIIKGGYDLTNSTGNYKFNIAAGTNVAVSGQLRDGVCYRHMLSDQALLKYADGLILPSKLTENCCYDLFWGDPSLKTPPQFPATKLEKNCYYRMFYNCESLETVPELPATTLADNCYQNMFQNCTSLTAPCELPATTMATNCYASMFAGCTGIVWESIGAPYKLPKEGAGIEATGWNTDMFVDNSGELPEETGTPAINTEYHYKAPTVLTFENREGYTFEITNNLTIDVEYSINNGSTWTTLTNGETTLGATKIIVKGFIDQGEASFGENLDINTSGVAVSGKLLDGVNYKYLFAGSSLSYADGLIASKVLNDECYANMFENTSLETPPQLPATQLAAGCYAGMFENTPLETAPALPATQLAEGCYNGMFAYCHFLTTPPELPATELAEECYRGMFASTSLTTLPLLPATQLAESCYRDMFGYCNTIIWGSSGTAYKIPSEGIGIEAIDWNTDMFADNSGELPGGTGTPAINTEYYYTSS